VAAPTATACPTCRGRCSDVPRAAAAATSLHPRIHMHRHTCLVSRPAPFYRNDTPATKHQANLYIHLPRRRSVGALHSRPSRRGSNIDNLRTFCRPTAINQSILTRRLYWLMKILHPTSWLHMGAFTRPHAVSQRHAACTVAHQHSNPHSATRWGALSLLSLSLCLSSFSLLFSLSCLSLIPALQSLRPLFCARPSLC
jgi:hypothetical protein